MNNNSTNLSKVFHKFALFTNNAEQRGFSAKYFNL